jgi:hypothetical protein
MQSTANKNRGEKKAIKALHKALEKGIDVNFEESSYRYTRVDQRNMCSQTDIAVGKNIIKAAAMNLLGKRCWINPQKDQVDPRQRDAGDEAIKRTNKIERQRAAGFKKKLKEVEDELDYKDQKLEESWLNYKEEVQAKRQAQRDLRLHRSASQEMCRKNDEMKTEIQQFHSNRTGYIKRSEYVELGTKFEEMKKDHQH